MKPDHGVASTPFCRLRLIRGSPARHAHRALSAESRPDGGGSPAPPISPPASALCPSFCSLLLPSDFHYKYPLIMHIWRGETGPTQRERKGCLLEKSVITGLGFSSQRIHRDSTWQRFTRTAPPGASSCFNFIISKLSCQGNFCPEMSSQKGTVALLLLFALKAILLLPPRSLCIGSGA